MVPRTIRSKLSSDRRQLRRKTRPVSYPDSVSPFAPYETKRATQLAQLPFLLFSLIRSGISPKRGDPKAWYDRWIRVVGGILILAFLGGALVVMLIDRLSGR